MFLLIIHYITYYQDVGLEIYHHSPPQLGGALDFPTAVTAEEELMPAMVSSDGSRRGFTGGG